MEKIIKKSLQGLIVFSLVLCVAQIESSQALSRVGLNVGSHDKNGNTPLHLAKSAQMVKLLMDNGADIEAINESGETPLYVASLSGNVAVVRALIVRRANLEAKDEDDCTPLHYAGSAMVARELILSGANKEAKDEFKRTPLHVAAESCKELRTLPDGSTISVNNVEIAQELIGTGANMYSLSFVDYTPMDLAIKNNDIKLVKMFLRYGFDRRKIKVERLKKEFSRRDSELSKLNEMFKLIGWYSPEIAREENTLFGQCVQHARDECEKGRPSLLSGMAKNIPTTVQKRLNFLLGNNTSK